MVFSAWLFFCAFTFLTSFTSFRSSCHMEDVEIIIFWGLLVNRVWSFMFISFVISSNKYLKKKQLKGVLHLHGVRYSTGVSKRLMSFHKEIVIRISYYIIYRGCRLYSVNIYILHYYSSYPFIDFRRLIIFTLFFNQE